MKNLILAILAIVAPLMFLSAAGSANAQGGGSCLDNRAIQSAISAGQILPLASALSKAGVDPSQEVLSVQVCDQGGGNYIYVVAVLNSQGQAENLTLSAN